MLYTRIEDIETAFGRAIANMLLTKMSDRAIKDETIQELIDWRTEEREDYTYRG